MTEGQVSVWAVLGRAWAAEIVLVLSEEPLHFNAVKRRLDGPPASTLSRRLRELGCGGLVERTESGNRPERVTYELTDRGEALADSLEKIDAIETAEVR